MHERFEDFTGLYPVQKTLKFELIPQGETLNHLQKSNFFEEDRERARNYTILKSVIDEYHRKFIDECLQGASFDWNELALTLETYQTTKELKDKKNLEMVQKRMRSEIASSFKKDPRFEEMFNKKLFSNVLPKFLEGRRELAALESFNKFSGYFIGFHKNRLNMYSDENEKTSISGRIVNENFPKFIENMKKYEKVKKEFPEAVKNTESELSQYEMHLNDMFSINHFNDTLTQKGIDMYNLAIGGQSLNDSEKLRGLNEFLNLAYQKDQVHGHKMRMVPLYKQILSDSMSFSYSLMAFKDDEEVLRSINDFYVNILSADNVLNRALSLVSAYSEFDLSQVYVRQTEINWMSTMMFDRWDVLRGMLRGFKAESLGDPNLEKTSKKVDKWLNSEEFSLSDIISSMAGSGSSFDSYISKIRAAVERIVDIRKEITQIVEISGDEQTTQKIKSFLDSIQRLFQLLRPFYTKTEMQRDTLFYAEFDDIYNKLSAIIPLYNQTRNYLTTKKFNTKKIRLNFKSPTLANGWDINKECDNKTILLKRGDKYYLGILNPLKKEKIKFEESSDKDCYQKMIYKLIPGPNKTLPKIFFSKKRIGYYAPSQEILQGYESEKHKKGDKFDLGFCHKLIDFFKTSIMKNEDWKIFDFNFSPTDSYQDLSEFYREVETQGYRIQFMNVSADTIDQYVEEGHLFLFQIYNKDFSAYAKGAKNMHTIYWDAAFSEKNLKDVVVKLNGEAELFYRDRSDISKIVHKKGEILVNRKCMDGSPVPESIHRELFEYHNMKRKDISDEARTYIDRVRAFESHYDIQKDRRYLEDKLYFHVPLTLNFKSNGKRNLNKMVIDKVLRDKYTHIIGVDRGERNLIYVSIIDRNGKIIVQRNLNVIDEFDYHEKLDQREKERIDARKSWNSIGKIKDLKEGYLSKAIHELCKMVIEYNAIIVLEDLNFGFKRGRFKVEKQVYQKFEKMLIDKMNYLVFKKRDDTESGGVLNAYQLTLPLESFAKLGKQSGILFYVPAAYTSKIDPTTGFTDLFNTSIITNIDGRRDFIQRFKSISYCMEHDAFEFTFDYSNFKTVKTGYKNHWTVYTIGKRIKYSRERDSYDQVDPTMMIRKVLSDSNIVFNEGDNLLDKILAANDHKLIDTIYYAFLETIKMRNRDRNEDNIISPVKNKNGEFFRTDPERNDIPKNSDANAAYNLALKGELMLQLIADGYSFEEEKVKIPQIEHTAWFKFMQTRCDQ